MDYRLSQFYPHVITYPYPNSNEGLANVRYLEMIQGLSNPYNRTD